MTHVPKPELVHCPWGWKLMVMTGWWVGGPWAPRLPVRRAIRQQLLIINA